MKSKESPDYPICIDITRDIHSTEITLQYKKSLEPELNLLKFTIHFVGSGNQLSRVFLPETPSLIWTLQYAVV